MKKATYVLVLAVVLVVALGGTAFAKGASPANRSSSFLAKGESYIAWSKAQTQMTTAGVADADKVSVHSNYSTTTVKCQVCHSAHKASATGDTLLQSTAAKACVPCHLGATATSSLKVSAGNRHGSDTGCTNGYCHAVAPHGAGDISKYATLKTAMLSDHADELLDAAIAAGDGAPVAGNIYETGADKSTATPIATIAVKNAGVTAALLNDMTDAETIALGRAVGTGYLCSNGGCHMNGNFNSLESTATFGAWGGPVTIDEPGYKATFTGPVGESVTATIPAGTYAKGDTATFSNGNVYDVWNAYKMRDSAIKGHTLAAVADLAVRDVAYANVGTCKSCHDAIDYRISATTKQFPHGNSRVLPDGTVPQSAGKDVANNAWFTVGAYLGSADTTITTKGGSLVSGSDGACLKCHRSDATTGVGFDF